jgi:gliding motility-associated-like protein
LNIRISIYIFLAICSKVHAVDFQIFDNEGCGQLATSFTITSPSPSQIASCSWNFGNDNTSTNCGGTIGANYTVPGTYNVTLTIVTTSGQTETVSKQVRVYRKPKPNFTSNKSFGCIPDANIQFSNQVVLGEPGANIVNYFWDFGDGRTSTKANPSYEYSTIGEYNVSLYVVDANGCDSVVVKPKNIKISKNPNTDFTGTNVSACAPPLNVQFFHPKDSLHPYPLTYLWDFGDGITSTLADPTHSYLVKNPYNVSLTVRDSVGCTSDTVKTKFVVIDTLKADFTISNNVLRCNPLSVRFTNTSNLPGLKLSWDLGNGNAPNLVTSVSTIYQDAGTYNIRLIASTESGCADTMIKSLTVVQKPNVGFDLSDSSKCAPPLSVIFNNTTQFGNTYLWDFGDGNTSTSFNANHIYASQGVYDVKLISTASNGCKDSMYRKQLIQIGTGQVFINASEIGGCKPTTISFDSYKLGPGTVNSVLWDYGDGSTVSGENPPPHTFLNVGTYTVKVTYNLNDACPPITATKIISIGTTTPPIVKINPDTVCVNGESVFYNVLNANNSNRYVWLFGDGSIGNGINVSHAYSDPKTYNIGLVTINNGCYDTVIVGTVKVNDPKADFSYVRNCFNKREYTFKNISTGYTSFFWILPNGATSTVPIVNYTFPGLGTYRMTIVAINSTTGCRDSTVKTINIKELEANIGFSTQNGCAPLTVTITDLNNVGVRGRIWDLGNGVIDTVRSPMTTYTEKGLYTIKLITTYTNGCKDTAFARNAIRVQKPDAGFYSNPSGGCAPLRFNLIDTSKSDFGFISEYFWKIDTLNENSDKNTTFLAAKDDTFNILHVVKDDLGCIDSISKQIITIEPKAKFTTNKSNACVGVDITFLDQSVGTGLQYLWDFGDGKSDTSFKPVHQYSIPGLYYPKLTVTSYGGCVSKFIRTIPIKITQNEYDFTADKRYKACPSLITTFSVIPDTIDYKVLTWDLGNGSISNDTNKFPATIYTQGGKYDIQLIVEDNIGCKDTIFKDDYVIIDGPSGTFSFFPKSGCAPLEVTFIPNTQNAIRHIWDFGDGNILIDDSLKSTIKYTYYGQGIPKPSLIMIGDDDCQIEPVKGDSIIVSKLDVNVDYSPPSSCDSADILFESSININNYDNIKSIVWDFGDGAVDSNKTSVNHIYWVDEPTTFTVSNLYQSSLGCKDTMTIPIKIFNKPNIQATPYFKICKNETAKLIASGTSNFIWSPNIYLSNPNISNPLSSAITDIQYQVIGYDTTLCTDTAWVDVKVISALSTLVSPDTAICLGDTAMLWVSSDSTSNNIPLYTWSPFIGLNTNRGSIIYASPRNSITYTVTSTSGLCTPTQDYVNITVHPSPQVDAGDKQYIIKGTTTSINASSPNNITSYAWTPTNNVECPLCPNTDVTPQENSLYTVSVTDINGCRTSDSVEIVVFEECNGDIVVVPNSFTPNGDGKNDYLYVRGKLVSQLKLFRIFDRWGALVFETTDINSGWDGTYQGKGAVPDVYVYYVEAICINGDSTIKKGNVTLIR